MISNKVYEWVLKVLAVGCTIVMMIISAQFSIAGFSFQNPDMLWMGRLLAVVLIVIEMILNYTLRTQENVNWETPEGRGLVLLIIAGLFAYAYGIVTNIVGILHGRALPDQWYDYGVPVTLGLFLEVVPEHLLTWAIIKSREKKEKKGNGEQHQHQQYRPPMQERRAPTPNLANMDIDALMKLRRAKSE